MSANRISASSFSILESRGIKGDGSEHFTARLGAPNGPSSCILVLARDRRRLSAFRIDDHGCPQSRIEEVGVTNQPSPNGSFALSQQIDKLKTGGPIVRPAAASSAEEEWRKKDDYVNALCAKAAHLSMATCPGKTDIQKLILASKINIILRRANISNSTMMHALVYLKRCNEIKYTSGDPLKDFIHCTILAHKYHSDRTYSNRGWSKITGLKPSELTTGEWMTFEALGYNAHVSPSQYAEI